ncbi:MAG: ThiF family adenylyltransferase [Thermoplasmata archaeon]|nr:ThiF family adenylyltransferase [Thermoplasmata archaeon]
MLRPRTKRSLSPFRLANGDILLARDVFGLGQRIPYDGSDALWRLLRLMDGTLELPALSKGVRRFHPGWDERATRRAVDRLARLGVIEEGAPSAGAALPEGEADRYSRNLDFFALVTLGSNVSAVDLQHRLRAARVTILGVGAIGAATATSLAAAGVGHLRLLDSDRVEVSNLNRQTLYRSSDVGRWKVDAAAEHLRELNPHLRVTKARREVLSPRDLGPLLDGCDLFVLGADRPHQILLWTNDAAVRHGTPWLDNSYSGPRCSIALFVPGRTPCLRCLQHELERRQRREKVFEGTALFPEPAGNAVIAPTAGIAGHLGALRALYFLAGLRRQDDGVLVQLNLWTPGETHVVRPRYWPECPTCGRGRRAA